MDKNSGEKDETNARYWCFIKEVRRGVIDDLTAKRGRQGRLTDKPVAGFGTGLSVSQAPLSS
ncbi:MAG: hypothetical protein LBB47_05895, partial [Spirochaetaceae bacterium]|nr:hypothetical protein [Spirochaetaceae bacterium]